MEMCLACELLKPDVEPRPDPWKLSPLCKECSDEKVANKST
jgi:hypothetical protein